MKLLRFSTNGFGALRGEFRFDPDRVTLLVDDNERGKSTLLSAITAALYGLDGDRRSHRVLTPLERWKPWDDGPYRVELELEADGERYTVTRDFDNGTVSVWSGRGQDVTADFRDGKDEYPVGLKLLGLDAEEFERCAMVRQGDLLEVVPSDERERRSPSLRAKLEAVADSRVGDTRASEALKVLEGALRRYNCLELEFTGTVENAMQRLEAKQHLLEAEPRAGARPRAERGPLEELADTARPSVRRAKHWPASMPSGGACWRPTRDASSRRIARRGKKSRSCGSKPAVYPSCPTWPPMPRASSATPWRGSRKRSAT
jgi:DNA repair exonuclease SbcCD ATPase subunit